MTWRVFVTSTSEPDIDGLDEADRAALAADLFAWLESGPPRLHPRALAGVEVFEDRLPSGLKVTSFVNEADLYAAILRVRRP